LLLLIAHLLISITYAKFISANYPHFIPNRNKTYTITKFWPLDSANTIHNYTYKYTTILLTSLSGTQQSFEIFTFCRPVIIKIFRLQEHLWSKFYPKWNSVQFLLTAETTRCICWFSVCRGQMWHWLLIKRAIRSICCSQLYWRIT